MVTSSRASPSRCWVLALAAPEAVRDTAAETSFTDTETCSNASPAVFTERATGSRACSLSSAFSMSCLLAAMRSVLCLLTAVSSPWMAVKVLLASAIRRLADRMKMMR
ncbi:hypothetical protein D3C76_1560970 [compost metagenome]